MTENYNCFVVSLTIYICFYIMINIYCFLFLLIRFLFLLIHLQCFRSSCFLCLLILFPVYFHLIPLSLPVLMFTDQSVCVRVCVSLGISGKVRCEGSQRRFSPPVHTYLINNSLSDFITHWGSGTADTHQSALLIQRQWHALITASAPIHTCFVHFLLCIFLIRQMMKLWSWALCKWIIARFVLWFVVFSFINPCESLVFSAYSMWIKDGCVCVIDRQGALFHIL